MSVVGLPFSMAICGLHELSRELRRSQPTHVISISEPGIEPPQFPPTIVVLALNFFDVESDNEIRGRQPHEIPNVDHALAILEFAKSIPPFGRLLLHCWGGISRSTAAAALIIAQSMQGNEEMAVDVVRRLRPEAEPNLLLIAAGDEILGCGGRLLGSLEF